jgi:hypothetical protein
MAKRTRYPGRPAGRRPTAKPSSATAATSTPMVRSGGLTSAELERAAALEAELVAQEKAASSEAARRKARGRGPGVEVSITRGASEPLSVRASHEYAYVARDVRRIALTAGLMFGILAALWVIVNIGGVGLP